MKSYLLDTHAWFWFLEGDKRLSRKAVSILENTKPEFLFLSPVSVWEVGMLFRKGRLAIKKSFEDWLHDAHIAFPLNELMLSTKIATRAYYLPLDHDDPADRLITATAVEYELTLVTVDRRLIGHDWLKTLS